MRVIRAACALLPAWILLAYILHRGFFGAIIKNTLMEIIVDFYKLDVLLYTYVYEYI